MTMTPEIEKLKALAAVSEPNQRKCSCHPDDAPVPCQREHALTHCKLKASQAIITQLQSELAALKAQGTFEDGLETGWQEMEEATECEKRMGEALCEDCPPVGYPTDKTRCVPCPRRPASRSQIQGEVGKEFPAKGEGE